MQTAQEISRVFAKELHIGDGTVLQNADIRIDNGKFVEIAQLGSFMTVAGDVVQADVVAPGFIDIQINGAKDRQFNDLPDLETVRAIAQGARVGGTAHVLPTFITAPDRDYVHAIQAVTQAMSDSEPGILGLHLEGPFLSPKRPGIHDAACIRPLSERDLEELTAYAAGVLLVTLAPENQTEGAVRRLVEGGAIVFAGHSAATSAELGAAVREGLSGATHLFNAMSQLSVREPGVVGGVLESDSLFAGIIADGHHVAWENVMIAARAMPDRLCLVTDAMRSLEGDVTAFEIGGKHITLHDGMLTDASGRLAGAHIAMDACVRNIVQYAGVPLERALVMASRNPARALGLEDQLGLVANGFRASLTLLNKDLIPEGVIVDGIHYAT